MTHTLTITTARYCSSCPECGRSIPAGTAISRRGDSHVFVCQHCTLSSVTDLMPVEQLLDTPPSRPVEPGRPVLPVDLRVDPFEELMDDLRLEYRLHALTGLELCPAVVLLADDGSLSWEFVSHVEDFSGARYATVVPDGGILQVTRFTEIGSFEPEVDGDLVGLFEDDEDEL